MALVTDTYPAKRSDSKSRERSRVFTRTELLQASSQKFVRKSWDLYWRITLCFLFYSPCGIEVGGVAVQFPVFMFKAQPDGVQPKVCLLPQAIFQASKIQVTVYRLHADGGLSHS